MPIEWKNEFRTGVELIDNQHFEIFMCIDSIKLALQSGDPKKEVVNTLAYLNHFVDTHFEAEERLMRESKYPDLEVHIYEHEQFKESYNEIDAHRKVVGPSMTLAVKTMKTLRAWTKEHIENHDLKLYNFLKTKG